jgi:predicted permease
LAVVWVALGIPWPAWASPSFDLIKGANASMAVFAAGITLSSIKVDINWQAVLGCILKLIVMPAVVLVLGLIFKMEPMNLKMLVIACSLPPAFSGIIIASQYDTYEAVGTSTLALNIVLFIAFCPLWIYITDLVVN